MDKKPAIRDRSKWTSKNGGEVEAIIEVWPERLGGLVARAEKNKNHTATAMRRAIVVRIVKQGVNP